MGEVNRRGHEPKCGGNNHRQRSCWSKMPLHDRPPFVLCGGQFPGTFDTSNLASMNRASSSALLTVSTSSFARMSLRCQCARLTLDSAVGDSGTAIFFGQPFLLFHKEL